MSWRDKDWKYRRSESTNIRKTFAAARKRLKEEAQKVLPIRKKA